MRYSALRQPILMFMPLMLLLGAQGFAQGACLLKPAYKVCFSGYPELVASRRHLTGKYKLKLDQYIPDLCFLERSSSVDQLKLERGVSVHPVALDDIAPLFARADVSRDSCDPRCEPTCSSRCNFRETCVATIPDELMVRLDDDTTVRCLLSTLRNLGSLGLPDSDRDALDILGFAGPLQPTDQLKLNVRRLKEFLANQKSIFSELSESRKLLSLLDRLGVVRIDPFEYATLRNGMTAGVIQSGDRYDRSLFERDLRGEGQVLGLTDDFLNTGHCFLDDPDGASPGPQHRKLQGYRADPPGAPSLHGTFVAGILAGSSSEDPEEPNNGQAPEARISFDSVWDIAAEGPIRSVLYQALQDQYDDGARIFSNSWGDSERGWYTNWSYDIDRFTRKNEDTLVLFAVENDRQVMSPENAKNVLAVGASKQANLKDYWGRAGRGPTCGGQRKPEIFAPGCRIRSAILGKKTDCGDYETDHKAHDGAAWGTACDVGQAPIQRQQSSSTDGVEVMPMHVSSCATSWACPAVAGAAALARQHLLSLVTTPSGALLRATLLNGTRDMTGVVVEKKDDRNNTIDKIEYPNDIEGWGRLILDDALSFTGERRTTLMYDVWNAKGFEPTNPARVRSYKIEVKDSAEPLKVTLVWTDPPPAPIVRSDPLVNDLDLRVQKLDCPADVPCYFLGNDFSNSGVSQAYREGQGTRDDRNNVEQILINNPATGKYCVSVVGERIHVATQGYALVVTGAVVPSGRDCRDSAL